MSAPDQFAEMRQQIEDRRGDYRALIRLQREWIGHDEAWGWNADAQANLMLEYVDECQADAEYVDPDDPPISRAPAPLVTQLIACSAELLQLVELVAQYPLEDFAQQREPDDRVLFAANNKWRLTVGDVRRARVMISRVQP